MAWTPTTFKARWAEFKATPDDMVTSALSEAATYCDARVFGKTYDQAIGLYAAHLLAISPFGQQARLDPKQLIALGGSLTTYHHQWKQLAKKASGPWTIGMGPTGRLA